MSIFSWLGSTEIASIAWASRDGKIRSAASRQSASKAASPPHRRAGAASPRLEARNSAIPPPSQLAPRRALNARVGLEQRVKQVVLPDAVDPQIATRETLALETCSLQKLDRGLVGRQAGRLQPVQF